MAMKDNLIDLLQERFTGHELDVPPGVWENVSGHLAAAASGEGLREALQDKFSGHEADVDPGVWQNISSQLGHGAAAGSSSFSGGWIAAGVAAVVVSAGLFLWNTNDEVTTMPATPAVVAETHLPKASEQTTQPSPEVLPTAMPPVRHDAPATAPVKLSVERSPVTNTRGSEDPNAVIAGTVPVSPNSIVLPDTAPATQPDAPHGVPPELAAPKTQKADPEHTAGGTNNNSAANDNQPAKEPAATTSTTADPGADPFSFGNDASAPVVYIPNVFTPQYDGTNDKLKITLDRFAKVDVTILSQQTGAVVFHTNDLDRMWDAHLPNGGVAGEGNYLVSVTVVDDAGRMHSTRQVVTLRLTL